MSQAYIQSDYSNAESLEIPADVVQPAQRPIRAGVRLIALVGVAILAIVSVVCIWLPASVSYDPGIGLLIWNSMQKGSSFNTLILADPQNLALDKASYWAAHSPGQYLIPAGLTILGIRMGDALKVIEIVGVAGGLLGYFLLYTRHFGFRKEVGIIACAILLLHRETLYPFVSYSGGPLLLFAAYPYFVIASNACLRHRGLWAAATPVIFFMGAFLKLSFALIAGSIISYSIYDRWTRGESTKVSKKIVQSLVDGALFGLFYALLNYLHASRGWTAATPGIGSSVREAVTALAYAVAGIGSGMVAFFWSLSRLGSPLAALSDLKAVSPFWMTVLVACGIVSAALIALAVQHTPSTKYRKLLLVLAVTQASALAALFLGGRLIAEDRHLWPVSAILLPGIVNAIENRKESPLRIGSYLLISVFAVYAVLSYSTGVKRLSVAGVAKQSDIAFPGRDGKLISTIEGMDRSLASGRNVFFFTEPDLASLVKQNSLLFTTNSQRSLTSKYAGAVDRVILVVHDQIVSAASTASLIGMFPQESQWWTTEIGSYRIFYSGTQLPETIIPSVPVHQ